MRVSSLVTQNGGLFGNSRKPAPAAPNDQAKHNAQVNELKAAQTRLASELAVLRGQLSKANAELQAAKQHNATQAARLESLLADNQRLSLLHGETFDEHSMKLGSSLGAMARANAAQLAEQRAAKQAK